jgi:coenzyme Q-binding protein COQ10
MPSHSERRRLRYAPSQMFDLVADVESYPQFVPWVTDARVLRRHDNEMSVEMEIGTRLVRKRFVTKAVLERPDRIEITSSDDLFDRYRQSWTFRPAADGRTVVEYRVDFQFRSRLLDALIGVGFADTARAVMGAFMRRARQVYGVGRRRAAAR